MNMEINRAAVKENSKIQLQRDLFGRMWLMALLVELIASAIIGFASSFTAGIATIIIAGPISFGLTYVFLSIARGASQIQLEDTFKGFTHNFGENLVLGLLIAVFTWLWSLLLFIPGIVKSYEYSLSFYIAVDHPEYDWHMCINESKRMTRGFKWQLFVLDLSFIGWYIVGSLCLGVGTLWVTPYHMTAKANYYEAIKNMVGPAPVQPTQPMQYNQYPTQPQG